ncbi:glutamate ligase domain-containing protein, partial [Corynebacterium nasicanis]
GAEAARRADLVIITDDNPRSEEPASIRAAVLAGAEEAGTQAEIREIGDRAAAIDALIEWARPGDAIVVAGKGHEVGQLIAGVNHHFDDREEVRRALKEKMS